jgi:LysM repeat protein
MKRGVWIKGVGLLVLVVILAAGLGACSRSAEVREGSGTTPIATAVSSDDQGPEATSTPVQTVVSAVTQEVETPGAGAQPTAEEATATAEPTDGSSAQATPLPTATSAPSSGGQQADYVWHTVQRGETLYSIARRYGTSWSVIAQVNGIANPSLIIAGTRLKIPTSGGTSGGSSGGTAGCRYRHTVQRGEWVWNIARQYGVSPYAILSANGMSLPSASTIYAGMVLCIP